MKQFFFAFIATISFSASAQSQHTDKWDSVAVFHREQRVLVQINEPGADSRLQKLFKLLNAGDDLLILSDDKSFKMDCGRNERAVTCILRMTNSDNVIIGRRDVAVSYALRDLKMDTIEMGDEPFEIKFLNSNGDTMILRIADGLLEVVASKKQIFRGKRASLGYCP